MLLFLIINYQIISISWFKFFKKLPDHSTKLYQGMYHSSFRSRLRHYGLKMRKLRDILSVGFDFSMIFWQKELVKLHFVLGPSHEWLCHGRIAMRPYGQRAYHAHGHPHHVTRLFVTPRSLRSCACKTTKLNFKAWTANVWTNLGWCIFMGKFLRWSGIHIFGQMQFAPTFASLLSFVRGDYFISKKYS